MGYSIQTTCTVFVLCVPCHNLFLLPVHIQVDTVHVHVHVYFSLIANESDCNDVQ